MGLHAQVVLQTPFDTKPVGLIIQQANTTDYVYIRTSTEGQPLLLNRIRATDTVVECTPEAQRGVSPVGPEMLHDLRITFNSSWLATGPFDKLARLVSEPTLVAQLHRAEPRKRWWRRPWNANFDLTRLSTTCPPIGEPYDNHNNHNLTTTDNKHNCHVTTDREHVCWLGDDIPLASLITESWTRDDTLRRDCSVRSCRVGVEFGPSRNVNSDRLELV